ncbi:MAG TPA: type II toxin-antitoxin system VapC family toxin [Steroidobacteraceae bacterium]|nr:type II toxin-antitoxin system VapC family toxin [Steroidobacteraceae bacterium]HRX87854.1 type II toxin-antitoxin system VapC family toxin [Steroidobacteraceae bacterium]
MLVLDTHVLVWWLNGAPGLSRKAAAAVRAAAKNKELVVAAISIFEISTAVRRGRLQLHVALDVWLSALAQLPEVRVEPVTMEVARMAGALDEAFPGDPADRMIAATAWSLDAPLVTADKRLRAVESLATIW